MRIKLLLFTALLGLLGFVACSDNLSTGPDGPINPSPGSGEAVGLHVSIQLPGAGAVPYSDIWIDNEALVDTLDVYVFSNKTERGDDPGVYTLESIVPQDTSRAVSTGGNITLQLKLEGRTADRRIYFIANGASQNALRFVDEIGWTTETEFLSSLTNVSPQQTPLLMTAVVPVTAYQLQNDVVNDRLTLNDIELKRVAARIDIQNHERLLIIDSVQLFNTPRQSYIIGQGTDALADGETVATTWPTINIRTHKVADGAAVDSFWKVPVRNDDPAIGDSVYIPSLYFPYENFANGVAADRQRLRIWGRLGSGDLTVNNGQVGTGVVYEVPLLATGDSIARNHRYILLIRNVLGSDLDAELTVNPWLAAEHDTIPYEVDAAYPSVTLEGNRLTGKTLDVVQAGGVITLAVSCNIQWEVEYEGAGAPAWISHAITLDEAGATPAGSNDIGKFLQLTVAANATGSERGYGDVWIKVYNMAEPGKFYRFTIRQAYI